jgi:hypothetical protein
MGVRLELRGSVGVGTPSDVDHDLITMKQFWGRLPNLEVPSAVPRPTFVYSFKTLKHDTSSEDLRGPTGTHP